MGMIHIIADQVDVDSTIDGFAKNASTNLKKKTRVFATSSTASRISSKRMATKATRRRKTTTRTDRRLAVRSKPPKGKESSHRPGVALSREHLSTTGPAYRCSLR